MGGDHKCPVCQATFTRPQHVARHMRSHTGDRPYKCQYCGDQFARSDLLSRHVNKCHASEKPLPTGTRRKGTASATRATTSKQACDQCVQSSLPCDGCNPCSKCVQRKCRCTYVKFHRQTAPSGPGHNLRPEVPPPGALQRPLPPSGALAGPSSSRIPLYPQPEDDFILGPPPSALPTMAETLYNSNSFSFPPLYPQSGSGDVSGGEGSDYASKFRAQAELYGTGGRTGLTPGGMYDPRPGSSTSSSSWLSGGWEAQAHDPHEAYTQQHHHSSPTHSQPRHAAELMPASSHHSSTTSSMHGNHFYPSVRYT
ncbi:unnamed protein product [Cyclocybe aegerita]|uniref:Uncharacterized protein n=1 Tax=Cyclocybe aegerita TaxID=1973307 RepID=A0A8S0XLQ9_CYCAE|nr:unnamed protein product [Cyclocybe aegerita]